MGLSTMLSSFSSNSIKCRVLRENSKKRPFASWQEIVLRRARLHDQSIAGLERSFQVKQYGKAQLILNTDSPQDTRMLER